MAYQRPPCNWCGKVDISDPVHVDDEYRYLDPDGLYCLSPCKWKRHDQLEPQMRKDTERYIAERKQLLDFSKPPFRPPNLTHEQLFDPEPDHPTNLCYQCHRHLPPDYHRKPWNEHAGEPAPMFDTQKCRETAQNRHRQDVPLVKEEPYVDADFFYYAHIFKKDKQRIDNHNAQLRDDERSFAALTEEYQRFVERWEDEQDDKRDAAEAKEREQEAKELARQQERDARELARQQEREAKEDAKKAEQEAKRKAEDDLWRPKDFKP
jgi:hypothetical protein